MLVDLVRQVGVCETCSGSEILAGFKAEVEGTIISVDPLVVNVTVARVAEIDGECAKPIELESPIDAEPIEPDPTTDSPSERPVPSPTITPSVDDPLTEAPTTAPTLKRRRPSSFAPTFTVPVPATEKPTKAPTARQPTKAPTTPAPTTKPIPAPTENSNNSPIKAPISELAPTVPTPVKASSIAPSSSGIPSDTPSMAPSTSVNCSLYQDTFQVPELPVTINYVVNVDEVDSTKSTLSAQIIYEGTGWLGFGLSPHGGMNGSSVIIGSIATSETVAVNPGKYYLGGHAEEFVSLAEQQTLVGGSITQNNTHTVLKFIKFLEEEGEATINGDGPNRFVVAYGFDNQFAYHKSRTSFVMSLSPCAPDDTWNYNYTPGNFTNGNNNTIGNYTDVEDMILVENPESIPFDGGSLGEFESSSAIFIGTGRLSAQDNLKPADAYAAAGNIENVLPASGTTLVRVPSLMLGLASALLML
jgi:DOMON domain